jgi:hypothetical protein
MSESLLFDYLDSIAVQVELLQPIELLFQEAVPHYWQLRIDNRQNSKLWEIHGNSPGNVSHSANSAELNPGCSSLRTVTSRETE